MKRILFLMVCISLISAAFAKADVSDKNAQLLQAESAQDKNQKVTIKVKSQWQGRIQDRGQLKSQIVQDVENFKHLWQLTHSAKETPPDINNLDRQSILFVAADTPMIQEIKILDELSLDTTKTEGKPAGLVALFQIKADSTVKDGCAFIFALVDYSLPVKTIIDLYIEKRKGHFNVYNSESGDISFSINREEKVELSGAWFQTQGVLLYELEGKAEQYVVALMRPAKTGDTYRMQATCRQTERMKRIRDGQDEGQNKNVEYSLELEAGVRILEVSKTGDVTKFSLTVTNFTKTQDAAKTTLIPKDSLVMGYVDDAGYGFTINENPVGSETHQALCAVIQLGKGGRWSDDEIYDSKEPQKVGNSWKINSAVAARNLAKTGLNAQVDTITGTATLEQVTEIEGTPCLKVRGEMSIKGMSMPSIPDFKVESAEMQMAYSATFPADITKGRIQESQEMRMTCSMRGNPPAAGGAIVLVQSTAERTLTTKMTYPK